jgi:hypothetical protein
MKDKHSLDLYFEYYDWRQLEEKSISLVKSGYWQLALNTVIIFTKSHELFSYIHKELKLNAVFDQAVLEAAHDKSVQILSNDVYRKKIIADISKTEFKELETLVDQYNREYGLKVKILRKNALFTRNFLNLVRNSTSSLSLIFYIFVRTIIGLMRLPTFSKSAKVLVVTPDWLIEKKGKYFDPSVQEIIADLDSSGQTYQYLTIPHRGYNRVSRAFNLMKGTQLTLESLLLIHFFSRIGGHGLIKWSIERHIEKTGVEVIYIASEYSRTCEKIIEAANKLGIMTIGVQHGAINSLHLGYSQGNWSSLHRPKKMMVKNQDASLALQEMGLDSSNIIPRYSSLGEKKKTVKAIQSNKRTEKVLIASNPFIQSRFQTVFTNLGACKLNRNLKIDIKLHPNEEKTGAIYRALVEQNPIANINILPANSDAEDILTKYDVVVSLGSNVLSESYSLGIPTIEIIDDIFLFERFYDEKHSKLLRDISTTSFFDLIEFLNCFDSHAWCLQRYLVE